MQFSAKQHDERYLAAADVGAGHALTFLEPRLTTATAPLARDHDAVCAFVSDELSRPVLSRLAGGGTRFVALRSAGTAFEQGAATDNEILPRDTTKGLRR